MTELWTAAASRPASPRSIDWRAAHPTTCGNLAPPSPVRAGLHCGPVVTGEMGSVKREIVFLGDTVNTAARIKELCRETGDRVLASADLIDRLELPSRNRQTLAWRSQAARQGRRPRALRADEGAPTLWPLPQPEMVEIALEETACRAVLTKILHEIRDEIVDGIGVIDLSHSPLGAICGSESPSACRRGTR